MTATSRRGIVKFSALLPQAGSMFGCDCWLTKTRRFFMPIPCGELRPQGKQVPAIPPWSTPLACYASRFPAPRNIHSLTHDSAHLHLSLPRHHHRHRHHYSRRLFTTPARAILTSTISAAVQSYSKHSASKSRACINTAGRAYSDGELVAHSVGGLRCDRARRHRSGHIHRRVTRAHRYCCQAAQT